MKKGMRLPAILAAASLLLSAVPPVFAAENQEKNQPISLTEPSKQGNLPDYNDYLETLGQTEAPTETLELHAKDAALKNGAIKAEYEGRSNVALLEKKGELSWNVGELKPGRYAVLVEYASGMQSNRKYELDVLLDGKVCYQQAEGIQLSKIWKQPQNEGEVSDRGFRLDDYGNELVTSQEEKQGWQGIYLTDSDGLYPDPLQFVFHGGETLTLRFTNGNIAVEKVILCNEEELPSYQELQERYRQSGYQPAGQDAEAIQAELPRETSDTMLNPTSDHMSAASQPQDAMKIKLNTIGQTSWQFTGQSITWEFTVPEDGLYKLALRVRQNTKRGVQVGRKILINGKVPCKELENYLFSFDDQWYVEELGGEQPYQFYLEAGKIHTLTMEISTAYPEIIRKLQALQYNLNTFYRKVVMVVGTDPDPLRDYMLESTIPEFAQTMETSIAQIEELKSLLYASGFEKGGEVVTVEELADQLKSFLEEPDDIPARASVFKDNIAALGNWLASLTQQPLEMDWVSFLTPGTEKPKANKNFFVNFGYGFQVFLASFFGDYASVGGEGQENALTVWINAGRDQAQVLKRLIENYFVRDYGIPVRLSLVQQGLVPATLSGRGPDVAVMVSPTDTVNLAVRDALVDLDRFTGKDGVASFEETKSWFKPNSMVLYQYDGKTYGMPMEEQFNMMFYRTDVFEELGLEPPDTWEEMTDVISTLSRNFLEVGIPSNMAAAGQQMVNESVFQTLLYQSGGSYYKNGWESTGFSDPVAIAAFKQFTEFFTKYSLPVEYDFYTRFRSGEMPLGIAPYVTYNLLTGGAPELKGLWKMVPVPGTVQEDGSIDRSVTGAGNGIVMFKKAADYEAAWTFIQWFAGAEAQGNYANEIENVLGPSARFDPANVEAFLSLAWDEETQAQILEQWDSMEMVPQTPASYFISRNITNAFRKVVYNGGNPRETLNSYNRDMNEEIRRKRKQFGLAAE